MLAWGVFHQTVTRFRPSNHSQEMDMSDTQNKTKHEIPSLKSLEQDFGQKFAYPASTKTYLEGSRPDIKAPIRMIEQLSTRVGEEMVANPPIPVYDTSDP
jgi:phosphomethylpyrimidine synthase